MKIFYDHLVSIGEVITEIESLEIEESEKEELARLVDETAHHEMVDVILTHLPEEYHEEFLERFHAKPHDPTLLEYLKARGGGIEEKLKQAGERVRTKLKQLLK